MGEQTTSVKNRSSLSLCIHSSPYCDFFISSDFLIFLYGCSWEKKLLYDWWISGMSVIKSRTGAEGLYSDLERRRSASLQTAVQPQDHPGWNYALGYLWFSRKRVIHSRSVRRLMWFLHTNSQINSCTVILQCNNNWELKWSWAKSKYACRCFTNYPRQHEHRHVRLASKLSLSISVTYVFPEDRFSLIISVPLQSTVTQSGNVKGQVK